MLNQQPSPSFQTRELERLANEVRRLKSLLRQLYLKLTDVNIGWVEATRESIQVLEKELDE